MNKLTELKNKRDALLQELRIIDNEIEGIVNTETMTTIKSRLNDNSPLISHEKIWGAFEAIKLKQ